MLCLGIEQDICLLNSRIRQQGTLGGQLACFPHYITSARFLWLSNLLTGHILWVLSYTLAVTFVASRCISRYTARGWSSVRSIGMTTFHIYFSSWYFSCTLKNQSFRPMIRGFEIFKLCLICRDGQIKLFGKDSSQVLLVSSDTVSSKFLQVWIF